MSGAVSLLEMESDAHTWRPLRFFNFSRFALSALFVLLYNLGKLPEQLGQQEPQLFYTASLIYLAISLLAFYPILIRRPDFQMQVNGHIVIDIVMINVLMHASGGVSSGLGMLLVISVANGSMLTTGRTPGLYAALATIAVLIQQVHSAFGDRPEDVNYPLAGLLGITLFVTALVAQLLARRARASEELARRRGADLANMAQLTGYIIQQMQTGVMVVDQEERVRLMNSAASHLIDTPMMATETPLRHYSAELLATLRAWKTDPANASRTLHIAGNPRELLAQFMNIGQRRNEGTLIFLEDAEAATRQAQQLKLAALGRLTASIAHEIRNPLSAISHAGALLGESPDLAAEDMRLTEIIHEQSQRINTIVENVLQLGKKDVHQDKDFLLKLWLETFVTEFQQSQPGARGAMRFEVEPADMVIRFDPNHLRQLLTNLCLNGLRHAMPARAALKLRLIAGTIGEGHGYLDIIDAGPGVDEASRAHIFEPFFTTEYKGTGLGLYLARELAVSNQAQLRYEPTASQESCFRLLFRTGML